jgi:peptide/nickel transport system substrate-binding protein
VGTGPYKFVDFKPGDMVRAEASTGYHVPNQPHFDSARDQGRRRRHRRRAPCCRPASTTGPGTCRSRTRSSSAWKPPARARCSSSPAATSSSSAQHTDPWNEVDGERASAKSKHPAFSDPAVREAMSLLIDRKGIQDVIYGRGGVATANFLNNPPRFRSANTKFEFNVDKANQILDGRLEEGLRRHPCQGRQVKLKFVYQTSINQPRQKTQAIIKQACTKAGIDLELKSVTAAVFFGSDVANPDTYQKFWADMEMYTTTMTQPDPGSSWSSSPPGRWPEGQQVAGPQPHALEQCRVRHAFKAAQVELDPVKRAAMFIKLNDLVVHDQHRDPAVRPARVRSA